MREYNLISADSHVLEPPHLWTEYMPKKFHHKVPRVVPDGEGGEAWQFGPDVPPAPIGIYASAGRRHEDVRWTGVTFAEANQGNFRAGPRVEEMDVDGIDAEVLFGSARMMSHFHSDADPEFHLAGCRAYNDWIGEEFLKVVPDRLIGLACMPGLGAREAIREMERCAKLGYRGVWLNMLPSGGAAIGPDDDPFWDAAQSMGMPIHFHVRIMRKAQKPKPRGVRGGDLVGLANVGAVDMMTDMPEIIASGVHDRFPRLVWVMVEAGSGWIPYILEQMDDRYWRNRGWAKLELEMLPSEYFRRNWLATFVLDFYGIRNRHAAGIRNIMWSTDYPHHICDWPYSRKNAMEMFAGVPEDERDLICSGNAARLYRLNGFLSARAAA
jgi:predicted TIM-barrel fold metal-dependent hydrolase